MLDHPNIISYYDSFEEDGLVMIEMEYADGGWVRSHFWMSLQGFLSLLNAFPALLYDEFFSAYLIFLFCRTLSQFLSKQDKPMEEKEILLIFHQMIAAIKYIHEHNILHR